MALIPLLSLVSLHWSVTTGGRWGFRKMVALSCSACVFWALLGGYLMALNSAWVWLSIVLLALGMALSATCVGAACTKKTRRHCVLATLALFPLVYFAIARLVSISTWVKEFDPMKSMSAVVKAQDNWEGRIP